MKENENKVKEFAKNPKKALFSLAYPILIAMIVQTTYSIVDTAFVGRLGGEAVAALTFSFPILFMLFALNAGIGTGIRSRISRFLGKGKKREAENTAMHGIIISIVSGFSIFLLMTFILEPLFVLFGATDKVVDLALQYMGIIVPGILILFPSVALNNIFSAQGDTKTPMKIQSASLILNGVLDPIFIFVLGLGIAGAALATVASFVFMIFAYGLYYRNKSYLNLTLDSFKYKFKIVKEIFKVGAPAALMMLTISVYVIFINRFMAFFGTDYVAAFGIASRLESIAITPVFAIASGLITLVGMFYGAKRYELLKSITWYGLKIGILYTSVIGAIVFLFPSVFMSIFTPENPIINIGSTYLMINVFTFPLMAISIVVSRTLQGLGSGLPPLVIQLTRVLFVAVPLAYIFIFVLNLDFVFLPVAMVVGGIVSSIIGILWLYKKFYNLK